MTEHRGPAELAAMQALAERVFPQTGYRSVGDLAWNFALSHDQPAGNPTALWRDRDEVIAWGWFQRPDELMLQVDPRYPELAGQVLSWAEALSTPLPPPPAQLAVPVAVTETVMADALIRRGYEPDDGPFFSCLSMPLSDIPPIPALPPGYRIRGVSGDSDAERWVAVHCQAFTGSRFDAGRRRHLTSVPPYRHDLDLAVEAPDGTFAAYCLGWYDEANATGEFEPVGASPEHRRLGLASAVCVAALHAFRTAGGRRAVVNARGDAAYPAPKRLYESLGFSEHTRTLTYRRPAGRRT